MKDLKGFIVSVGKVTELLFQFMVLFVLYISTFWAVMVARALPIFGLLGILLALSTMIIAWFCNRRKDDDKGVEEV